MIEAAVNITVTAAFCLAIPLLAAVTVFLAVVLQ